MIKTTTCRFSNIHPRSMKWRPLLTAFVGISVLLFSACNRTPDHAKYIPKDAILTVGVNLKALGKKVAWNVITGSKLFKEIQQRLPEKNANDAVSGVDKSGIDFFNTLYFYAGTDARVKGGNRVVILIPLNDAAAWGAYVQKIFPKLDIHSKGDRREMNLNNVLYIAWTHNLLVATNILSKDALGDFNSSAGNIALSQTEIDAEVDKIFQPKGENAIVQNKNFMALEKADHDFSIWMNYDQAMTQYMNNAMLNNLNGLYLSNTLWKDAAMAAGIDFKTGKITGDIKYYVSPELKDIANDLGGTNADPDMMDRLPKKNLDLLMAWHLSPTGVKKSFEKLGLLGKLNFVLAFQGLSVDSVLNAVTGDMAVAVNDLNVKMEKKTEYYHGQQLSYDVQQPNVNMTVVLKINKKENFMQLFNLYKSLAMVSLGLTETGKDEYAIAVNSKDSVFLVVRENFAIISNKHENVDGFLQGTFKGNMNSDAALSSIAGYPVGCLLNIRQIATHVDATITGSAHDSLLIAESKNLLKNTVITGGKFKDNAFESHFDVNFVNTEESSIITLMDYGMRLSEAEKKAAE
jgi:Domain of unknown function (DUF4836)